MLPKNVSNLWDFLTGDELFVEIEFRQVNTNGNAVKKDSLSQVFYKGAKKTVPVDKRKYFKIGSRSTNAKHIEITDEKSSPASPIKLKTSGEYLKLPKVDSTNANQIPLALTLVVTLYGGMEERISVHVSDWV